MAFLYGDLSPSPLTFDYLGYLRRTMALAVEVLIAEGALAGEARRRRALAARTADLERRLEALRQAVRGAIGAVARAPEDDPVIRCANHIEGAVDDVIARGGVEVRSLDAAAEAEIAARERAARTACRDAAASFLRAHDFPGASRTIELGLAPAGHVATLRAATPYGVAYELDLDLAESPFAAPEVRAGALTRTRIADLKLDKLIVARVRCDERDLELELRAGREAGVDGYQIAVARASGQATLTRLRRQGGPQAMTPSADDERALAALAGTVAAALEARATRRTRLRGVTLDDVPFDDHERPSMLVDRVFAAMAPEVHVIVAHSKAPGELSLREELPDGRREEIFVSHAALAEVVGQVPVARRRHFDVLRLPGIEAVRAGTAEVDPAAILDSADLMEASDSVEISDPSISVDYGRPATEG